MREHLASIRALGWVEREQGGEELGSGVGLEGEVGTDHGTGCSAGAREAKRFCIGQAFEVRPSLLGGDAAEFEYLKERLEVSQMELWREFSKQRGGAHFRELVDFIFALE